MEKEQLFRKIIDENRDRIFRICNYYFHDDDDRDDAYQEALIRIWENLSSFKNRSQISTWLFRVTVNTCLMFIRKDKSRKKIFEGVASSDLINLPDKPMIEDDPVAERKHVFFRSFLDEISALDKTIVSLYLEEISSREIAEITGLSEVNARIRIHRIKEKIRNKWKEEQNGIR